jgi:hypothetical protein
MESLDRETKISYFMELTKEEFNQKFTQTLDVFLEKMAENEQVDVRRFYTMATLLENFSFFGPVIYDIIRESPDKKRKRKNSPD